MALRDFDWDGVLTFGLTLVVVLISLGGVLLVVANQVVVVARSRADKKRATDWLIVPGKHLLGDTPDDDFRRRLRCAAALARTNGRSRILILGGVTSGALVSEAEAGEAFLRSLPGGSGLRVVRESSSTNTLENLRNARELLGKAGSVPGPATLISNRYHLARLGLIADSLGIDYLLWPAEARFQVEAVTILKLFQEALFCLWFKVGRRWAATTQNGRMLARVT